MIGSDQKPIKEKYPELEPGVLQPQFLNQIVGFFQTVSTAPTNPPRYIQDQIQIYVNGGTKRVYFWDNTNQAWSYATLT